MKLSFAQEINGKPNHFVEKIRAGFKVHTIRRDVQNLWHAGMPIELVINIDTPACYQFAPVVYCIRVQRISIRHLETEEVDARKETVTRKEIWIDDRLLTQQEEMRLIANDGFDSPAEFYAYFDQDFKGKLIQWTDLKY